MMHLNPYTHHHLAYNGYGGYGRGTVDIPDGPIVKPVPRPDAGPQPFPKPPPKPSKYMSRRQRRRLRILGRRYGYGALPYYGAEHEGASDLDTDLAELQSDLAVVADDAGEALSMAGGEIAAAVAETRQHKEHRKFLYMVGAPIVVYAGLTNKTNRTLGLLSALVGAYVGIKNYQDEQAEAARMSNLGRFGRY